MLPPGAATSGLRVRSADIPNELKSETRPAVGLGDAFVDVVQPRLVDAELTCATSEAPSLCATRTTGMVIGWSPWTVGLRMPGALL